MSSHIRTAVRIATIAGLGLVASSTQAAVYTWTGVAADGDWTNATNWDANGVPVDTDAGVAGLDQQNPADNIIISGTAPTVQVPTFSGGNAFGGGTANTPEVDVLLGTLTVSVNTWGGQGVVHRGGNWNSSVGDGDAGNGLAVLNYNVVQGTGNGYNRDDNGVMTWTVNADGTLNFDNQGTTLKMAYSSTRTVGFNLPGGTVNFAKALDLGGHAGNFFDLTAAGASVTAAFGGSFGDLSTVNTAIDNNIHFISSNAQPLAAVDNEDGSFTVAVGGDGTFPLTITPNASNPGNYDFEWESQDGKLYDLVSSTGLATATDTWPVYLGNANIEGSAPTNMLPNVAGGDPTRYFAVIEKDPPPPPPLLSEGFENDNGGFTFSLSVGTDWAWGTPTSTNDGATTNPGGSVTEGNGASSKCWGTGIGNPGYYDNPTTDSCLRSAVVDLTGVTAAELTFAQALDLDAGDSVTVNIIDDTTDTPFATDIITITDTSLTTSDWESIGPIAIPAAAIGEMVRIEWCLSGTGGTTFDFMGWYIDDVVVEDTSP